MKQNQGKTTGSIYSIHEWWVSRKSSEKIKKKLHELHKNILETKMEKMKEHIRNLPKNTFIPVREYPIVFSTHPEACLLAEDVHHVKLKKKDDLQDLSIILGSLSVLKKLKEMGGFKWKLCNTKEAVHLCRYLAWRGNKEIRGITLNGKRRYFDIISGNARHFDDLNDGFVADLYVSHIPSGELSLSYVLRNGCTPKEGRDRDFWDVVALLFSRNLIKLSVDENHTGYVLEFDKKRFSLETLKKLAQKSKKGELLSSYFSLSDADNKEFFKSVNWYSMLFRDVLQCDRMRCDLSLYSVQMLMDPNKGSWDLWETDRSNHEGMVSYRLKKSFYARDPRQDISSYGVIGIDFGTKSTVVTYLEDKNYILPLRIGTGELDRDVRKEDYENPTVMEFRDIQQFLKDYQGREGKPMTRWEDLDISHTAAENWANNGDSNNYSSFFGGLKQWAGTEGKQIYIRDRKGCEKTLPPYLNVQEGDLDPIELYAYYIGLYLNNQHIGKIYMRYILSFPVTYPQKVREHILQSFSRGLKKSLPLSVVQDEECMKQFRVEMGAGEPEAYAVCALQELQKKGKISLSENQPIFYGVFDFGGGTSDFDFGIWRKAKRDKKEKRYDYVIRHFAAGGKQYLGGENLLKKLAYQVFMENATYLQKEQIPFARVPECKHFPGDEIIVSDSQEAETNTRRLMEALRPFWERNTENADKNFKIAPMRFFNRSGEPKDRVELTVNVDTLDDLLENELKGGIKAFFDLLVQVRGKYTELSSIEKCHILLAGRSSQSLLFQRLFRQAIEKYKKDFEKSEEEAGRGIGEGDLFELHKPLGSEEIEEESQKRQGEKVGKSDFFMNLYEANGKTGVAVGLLQCRKGGKIKVISEMDMTQAAEIPFSFYVGEAENDVFQALLTPNSAYGVWKEFEYAMETDNEFYYTTNPSAGLRKGNGLKCSDSDVYRANCMIPEDKVNEDDMIYWRPVDTKTLEYVVAESEAKVNDGVYLYGPKKISLGK